MPVMNRSRHECPACKEEMSRHWNWNTKMVTLECDCGTSWTLSFRDYRAWLEDIVYNRSDEPVEA